MTITLRETFLFRHPPFWVPSLLWARVVLMPVLSLQRVRNALEIAAGYSTFSRKYLKDSRRVFAYTRCVRRTDAELCSAGV